MRRVPRHGGEPMTLQDPGTRTFEPPEPDLTPDELVARATAMRETLRERQDECEDLGRLPDSTAQDYIDAGFWRVVQPRRFGGYEFDLDTFLRITVELSRGCPSSGWVYGLTAAPQPHRRAASRSRARSSCSATATSAARCPTFPRPPSAVDGGYVVTGWWDYSSGCDVATHFIGGAVIVRREPTGRSTPGGSRCAATSTRSSTTGTRSGCAAPARGASSCEDLFIPEHHTVPSPNPIAAGRRVPRSRRPREPDVPRPARVAAHLRAGGGVRRDRAGRDRRVHRGAHDEAPVRPDVAAARRADGVPAAPGRGDRLRRHRRGGAATRSRGSGRSTPSARPRPACRSPTRTTAGSSSSSSRSSSCAAQVVELVFRTSGSSASNAGQRIERYFRDLNMVRTHVTLQYERTWENVGRCGSG